MSKPKYIHKRKESYSSLSLYENCPYQYRKKYIERNFSKSSTIALEMGTLVHAVMEQKMKPNQKTDLEDLKKIFLFGHKAEEERDSFLGLKELKVKYSNIYDEPARNSGMTYDEKLKNLKARLLDEDENGLSDGKEWYTKEVEKEFVIEFNGIKIGGFIDRIDTNDNGDLKIIDYKTSDKIFDEAKTKTPMQMYIYALASLDLYGKMPVEFEYDFILLGEKQKAMTRGWKSRGEKKLTRIINKLLDNYVDGEFVPKPTPLCYWCDYNEQGLTQDEEVCTICDYFSLWTPDNRTWEVNKKWGEDEFDKDDEW